MFTSTSSKLYLYIDLCIHISIYIDLHLYVYIYTHKSISIFTTQLSRFVVHTSTSTEAQKRRSIAACFGALTESFCAPRCGAARAEHHMVGYPKGYLELQWLAYLKGKHETQINGWFRLADSWFLISKTSIKLLNVMVEWLSNKGRVAIMNQNCQQSKTAHLHSQILGVALARSLTNRG